jgi:hypothetical protein
MGFDGHMRVKSGGSDSATFNFGEADICRVMGDLALEVGHRHHVIIDNPDGADPSRCEIHEQGRTKSTGANQQDAGGFEFLLPGAADIFQDKMALVALDFSCSERCGHDALCHSRCRHG